MLPWRLVLLSNVQGKTAETREVFCGNYPNRARALVFIEAHIQDQCSSFSTHQGFRTRYAQSAGLTAPKDY